MKTPEYETMTRIEGGGYTVRVWCSSPTLAFGPDAEIEQKLLGLHFSITKPLSIEEAFEEVSEVLKKCARVSAYEVLNDLGDGVVFYPDGL